MLAIGPGFAAGLATGLLLAASAAIAVLLVRRPVPIPIVTTVDALMTCRPQTLAASVTLADAVSSGFGQQLFNAFPVVDAEGIAVGLVALSDVRGVPFDERPATTVAQVMCADPDVFVTADAPIDDVLASAGFALRGRAVVVGADGRPIGLVSVTDVRRRLGMVLPDPVLMTTRRAA